MNASWSTTLVSSTPEAYGRYQFPAYVLQEVNAHRRVKSFCPSDRVNLRNYFSGFDEILHSRILLVLRENLISVRNSS